MKLENKAAIVTGGSRGIGKATAVALGMEGCRVAICGKDKKNLSAAEVELKNSGIDVYPFLCDVSKPAEIKKFASSVVRKFGQIDIVVNNAGVAYYKDFKKSSEEEINQTIDVNIRGLILLTKYLLPKINKNGIIINISSGAGKHGFGGLSVYCASKFAVIGFTESLAQELKGIRTVSICPGGVDTEMYMSMSGFHPGLKPEHIAAKIIEVCTEPRKFKSGSAIEVYKVSDALNYLKMKYFRKK